MKMDTDKEEDITISKESIDFSIKGISNREDNFLLLSKDKSNCLQCYCFDLENKFYRIEKMLKNKWFVCNLSTQLSTIRCFQKYAGGKEYKAIKEWELCKSPSEIKDLNEIKEELNY